MRNVSIRDKELKDTWMFGYGVDLPCRETNAKYAMIDVIVGFGVPNDGIKKYSSIDSDNIGDVNSCDFAGAVREVKYDFLTLVKLYRS